MKRILLLILALTLVYSCEKEATDPTPDPGPTPGQEVVTYKVAMIFPKSEWESIHQAVDWALETLASNQKTAATRVELALEWIDEEGDDLQQKVRNITHDKSYAAIIGPEYSSHARFVAQQSLSYRIPVLLPTVTSAEVQRIFSESNQEQPNVFCLVQSDFAQCEAIINEASKNGVKSLFLVSRNSEKDDYASSFAQYFTYLSIEAGIMEGSLFDYASEAELASLLPTIAETMQSNRTPGIVFVPSSTEDMVMYDRLLAPYKGQTGFSRIYCTDIAHEPSLEKKLTGGPYEGFSAGATDRFEQAWATRYGSAMPGGYAQIYDAVLLVGNAARKLIGRETETLREALVGILTGSGYNGESGTIRLSGEFPIAPDETIYQHWSFQDGQFSQLGNVKHNAQAGWDLKPSQIQKYEDSFWDDDSLPALKGHKALIVATSTGWKNYRHQADALAMYQMLKGFGYTDDQIILIMEDDVATHPSNPYPGEVRVTPDGEDLRKGAVVDYVLSSLKPDDLVNIVGGNATTRTPVVLEKNGNTHNLFVFWAGHGVRDYELKWGDNQTIDWEAFIYLIAEAKDNHRQMMTVMDTCFSGSLAEVCELIPNALFLCSAARGEPSHADVYDEKCGVYLSNGFTRAFRKAVENKPDITMNDLYIQVARNTTGSHAGMYNYYYYGSLYHSTMAEYLKL